VDFIDFPSTFYIKELAMEATIWTEDAELLFGNLNFETQIWDFNGFELDVNFGNSTFEDIETYFSTANNRFHSRNFNNLQLMDIEGYPYALILL
jgi:hypothetical protein